MPQTDRDPVAAIVLRFGHHSSRRGMHHVAGEVGRQVDPSVPTIIESIRIIALTKAGIARIVKALGDEVPVAIAGIPGWGHVGAANRVDEGIGDRIPITLGRSRGRSRYKSAQEQEPRKPPPRTKHVTSTPLRLLPPGSPRRPLRTPSQPYRSNGQTARQPGCSRTHLPASAADRASSTPQISARARLTGDPGDC
jgi:hypothetical protein